MGKIYGLVVLVLALATGCGKQREASVSSATGSKIRVTTTVTMITDLVQHVGGERVEVTGLMGPGVDPHLYKAAAADVSKLQNADVIFYCGLLLEGKMQDVFAKMARTKKHVYAVTESIPQEKLLEPPEFSGHYDPHVWFEVPMWAMCVDTVMKGLSEFEPRSKDYFEQRGKELKKKLDELHQWATKKANELPKEKRILVTSHDAYNYFGRAYGFKWSVCKAFRRSKKPMWQHVRSSRNSSNSIRSKQSLSNRAFRQRRSNESAKTPA